MSPIKFNKNRFPFGNGLTGFFDRDSLFNNDFFNLKKSLPAMNIKEHDNDFEIELALLALKKRF